MSKKKDPTLSRVSRLLRKLHREKLPAMIVTDPVNVSYLSGFTGDDSWLLVGQGKPCLLTDFRYTEQAERECPGVEFVIRKRSMIEALTAAARRRGLRSLGFDPEAVSVALRGRLEKGLGRRVRLGEASGFIRDLRIVKDETELRAIRGAVRVAEAAFTELRKRIELGMTEVRIAAELDHLMRLAGAEAPAFPTICAIDAAAAMPHARPGMRRLKNGSVLLIDFGARVRGYVCDLTRVLFVGKIRPYVRSVYAIVHEAQAAAIAAARPAAPLSKVHAAARKGIEEAGFGDNFQHGTGHGIGREVHEPPSMSHAVKGHLASGMVVTVEPGIYLRGQFGIRIEDDVLITPAGPVVLTRLEKDPEAMVL
jgi:Xaa-Pro aminopeptidase